MPSSREKAVKRVGEEIMDLLSKPTAKEKSLADKFKSQGGQYYAYSSGLGGPRFKSIALILIVRQLIIWYFIFINAIAELTLVVNSNTYRQFTNVGEVIL